MSWQGRLKYTIYQKAKRIIYKKPSPDGVILMYHRIGSRQTDPWEIFVSEENFRQHLEWLTRSYQVHPLSELDLVIPKKDKPQKHVFITFDDGCFDNFDVAVPLLNEFHLPATFFIPTGILTGQTIFWWEMLDQLFWGKEALPECINLSSGKKTFIKKVLPSMRKRDPLVENKWSANREPAPSDRCQLYLDICKWIRECTSKEQMMITDQLIKLYEDNVQDNLYFKKMSSKEIALLAEKKFDIGGHTVHHPSLKFHDYNLQKKEIISCKSVLEEVTGKKVVSFAYPHGEYNEDTFNIIKEAGIKYACTTDWGAIDQVTERLLLPRMLVRNTGVAFFKKQLDYLFNQ